MDPRRLATLLLATAGCLAQTVVIPHPLASVPQAGGPLRTFNDRTFAKPASRTQLICDVAAIPVAAATWTALQLRMPAGPSGNLSYLANATIAVGMSTVPYTFASPTFAHNLAGSSTVFSGPLSLPARSATPAWPMAWEAPVPFTLPYVYTASSGQALVVDLVQATTFGVLDWNLEAWAQDTGRGEFGLTFQPACRFGSGPYTASAGATSTMVGASWGPSYSPLPPNLSGFGVLGAQGPGGSWGGLPLPIDLAPFGAAGCVLGVSVDLAVPLVSNASGLAVWPQLTIPSQPSLVGLGFFEQPLFLDATANALGVVPGHTNRWIVGSGVGGPGALVSAVGPGAATQTSGVLVAGLVTTLLLR
jgi:hypothetical protein